MRDDEIRQFFSDLLGKHDVIIEKLDGLLKQSEELDIEGIVETYPVTANSHPKTLWPPVKPDRKTRHTWLWVQVVNDSETVTAYAGVNVGNVNALEVAPHEKYKISFTDKKRIKSVNYKTESGEAALRIICTR